MANRTTIWTAAVVVGVLIAVTFTPGIYHRIGDDVAFRQFLLGTGGFAQLLVGAATLIAGVVTVYLLMLRAEADQKQIKIATDNLAQAQKTEVSARFQKGVELLSSSEPASNLGGIYVLRDVAEGSEQYRMNVIELLIEYMRQKTAERSSEHETAVANAEHLEASEAAKVMHRVERPTEVHVAEAMRTVGWLLTIHRRAVADADAEALPRLDFRDIALFRLNITGDFRSCLFTESKFHDVRFLEARLDRAIFALPRHAAITCVGCSMTGAMITNPSASRRARGGMLMVVVSDFRGGIVDSPGATLSLVQTGVENLRVAKRMHLDFKECWFDNRGPRLPPGFALEDVSFFVPARGTGDFRENGVARVYHPGENEPLFWIDASGTIRN